MQHLGGQYSEVQTAALAQNSSVTPTETHTLIVITRHYLLPTQMGHDRLNFDFPIGACPLSMTSPCDVMVPVKDYYVFFFSGRYSGWSSLSDIREDVSSRSVSWSKVEPRASGILTS